jgi:phage baseplate assembly protein W|tara:strand:- start:1528 stop:1929 length:402 start_codon:yes stop_codon:yes gene_type:complete
MPVERVSKTFKDISMSFRANPVSSDLIGLKDENAISRSIRNLVLTAPGERFFNQNLGSRVSQSLFENLDEITASIIKDEIKNTILNHEPRVRISDVDVRPNFDSSQFDVVIKYSIVGVEVLPQQLSFALQPTR